MTQERKEIQEKIMSHRESEERIQEKVRSFTWKEMQAAKARLEWNELGKEKLRGLSKKAMGIRAGMMIPGEEGRILLTQECVDGCCEQPDGCTKYMDAADSYLHRDDQRRIRNQLGERNSRKASYGGGELGNRVESWIWNSKYRDPSMGNIAKHFPHALTGEQYWMNKKGKRAEAIHYNLNNPNGKAVEIFFGMFAKLTELALEITGETTDSGSVFRLSRLNNQLLTNIMVCGAQGGMGGNRRIFCRRLTEILWLVERGSNEGGLGTGAQGVQWREGEGKEEKGSARVNLLNTIRAGFTSGWERRTSFVRAKLVESIHGRRIPGLTISWGDTGRALNWEGGTEWIDGLTVEHDYEDQNMIKLDIARGEEDPAAIRVVNEIASSGDEEGDEDEGEGEED